MNDKLHDVNMDMTMKDGDVLAINTDTQTLEPTTPVYLEWHPLPDITLHELALCMPYIFKGIIYNNAFDTTQPHLRHFKITKP